MKQLNVALLQLLPTGTLQGNLEKGLQACRTAKMLGADIALFPEMWNIGYDIPKNLKTLRAQAIAPDSAFVTAFANLAKELEMAIAVSFLEAYQPRPRNSLCLFDRSGKQVWLYAKMHTCDFARERSLTRGDGWYVAALDTAKGPVQVGALICYDREFPEASRVLMLKGAELVLVSNAGSMDVNRISQLRARAFENMMAYATANYPKGNLECNGNSSAFDGILNETPEAPTRDSLVLLAGENEGIYMAPIPIDALRAYRKTEPHGNAYRRPDQYALLCEQTVNPPFRRKGHRR